MFAATKQDIIFLWYGGRLPLLSMQTLLMSHWPTIEFIAFGMVVLSAPTSSLLPPHKPSVTVDEAAVFMQCSVDKHYSSLVQCSLSSSEGDLLVLFSDGCYLDAVGWSIIFWWYAMIKNACLGWCFY